MAEPFDVMRWKGQWDKATRRVVEERLAQRPTQGFFDEGEVAMLAKLVAALLPDVADDIPIVEILGSSLVAGEKKGVRMVDLPWRPEMYKQGLAFLDEEARRKFGAGVTGLSDEKVFALLGDVSAGQFDRGLWEFPAELFFRNLLADMATICYSYPQSWSRIAFAGPAYPRGFYRLECDEAMWYEPELKPQE